MLKIGITGAGGKLFGLPDELVTRTQAILAIRGGGKTYTALVQMEELLTRGLQAVAIDPTGVWWGLRSSADGKRAGFPVLVFGGDHGDIPLEPTAGALIADFLVDSGRSAVLDLSAFESGSAQDRFAEALAERLYRRKSGSRSPMHLFVDEADSFAPQRPMPGQQRMLGAFEAVVRRGRSRGMGMTLITQRPAVLNKNVLTQVDLLTCLRVSGPQDHKAILAWVELHGDEARRETMMGELASLPKGTAWLWSPGWLGIFERVSIRRRTTFDSSATPETGASAVQPKTLAEVDLNDLSARIKETKERAEANDPAKLRRRIAELERDLDKARSAVKEKRIELPVLRPADLKAMMQCSADVSESIKALQNAVGIIERSIHVAKPEALASSHRCIDAGAATTTAAVDHAPRSPHQPPRSTGDGPNGGLRRMLIALAQRPRDMTSTALGVRAGLSSSSGTFGTYLGRGRSEGWIAGTRDHLTITGAGLEALGSYDPLPEGPALLDYWLNQLGGGAARMLRALAESEGPMTRAQLGERAGLEAKSGTFGTYLGKLRTLELVTGRGDDLRLSVELRS